MFCRFNITDVGFHPDNILTQDGRKHGNFNTVDSGTLHLENIYKIYFSSGYMTEISVELNQLTARSWMQWAMPSLYNILHIKQY